MEKETTKRKVKSGEKVLKKGSDDFESLLKIEDLSGRIGMSVAFIHKAKDKFGLPFYKIGGAVRFRISEIETWLKQRKSTD